MIDDSKAQVPVTAEQAIRRYNRDAQRRKRARRLAKSLCAYCARNPPRPGLQSCEPCGVAQAARVKACSNRNRLLSVYRHRDVEALARGHVPRDVQQRAILLLEKRERDAAEKATIPRIAQ